MAKRRTCTPDADGILEDRIEALEQQMLTAWDALNQQHIDELLDVAGTLESVCRSVHESRAMACEHADASEPGYTQTCDATHLSELEEILDIMADWLMARGTDGEWSDKVMSAKKLRRKYGRAARPVEAAS